MDESLRAALAAWTVADWQPLVRLLGFDVARARRPRRTSSTVGRSGSTAAILLRSAGGGALARAQRITQRDPARRHLFLIAEADNSWLELLAFDPENRPRRLRIDDVRAPRAFELDALRELIPANGESGIALAMRHQQALDRSRVGTRFFATFKEIRGLVSAAWTGLPPNRRRERDRLALLFLCRLLFLYFLQRSGHLAGHMDYFQRLRRRHARVRTRRHVTFYRATLVPLFHGVLNRRPERRSPRAARLGQVPYLNGGLFERDVCERRFRQVNLPDHIVDAVFDRLLERFRFTTNERTLTDGSVASDDAIDPEMLGRVFEGLMDQGERVRTGTFYTPSALVDEVVAHGLAALASGALAVSWDHALHWVVEPANAPPAFVEQLRNLRVLDPACGSGAFLLGTIAHVTRICRTAGANADVGKLVGESLHGVDVQDDAALLCALRLWLTLLAEMRTDVKPLPNLDRRIRQGDALLDPLDLYTARHLDHSALVHDADFRARIAAVSQAAFAYLHAQPESKATLSRQLGESEHALSLAWIDAQMDRMKGIANELRAAASARDLFGAMAEGSGVAQRQLQQVLRQTCELRTLKARLRRRRGAPFFSFVVHFADAMQPGFDLVVSNPPWVRAHRWPKSTAALVRARYRTCDRPGWPYAARLVGSARGAAAQIDLAVLFLELAIRVLRPGGVVAMVLPAKILRSLFGAGARRLLLEQTEIVRLEDRSLQRRSIFDADAFVATVVARKRGSTAMMSEPTTVALHGRETTRYSIPADELPLVTGDRAAPWLLAPPPVAAILRAMQRAGRPLGEQKGLVIRRGIMTGANKVLVLRHVEQRLSGLTSICAEGSLTTNDEFCAVVESRCVRPLLRGSDVRAWQCVPSRHVLWLYDEHLQLQPPPRFTSRYLERHAACLGARSPGAGTGALFRVSAQLMETLVLWRDLAPSLEAAALLHDCCSRPVPLNSVYFVATRRNADDALLLAAYLNSLPVRVFARTIAERAKNGYFRFFAWTVGVLPLPGAWRTMNAPALRELARDAHLRGGIDAEEQAELDRLVSLNYALTAEQLEHLRLFDGWLSAQAM